MVRQVILLLLVVSMAACAPMPVDSDRPAGSESTGTVSQEDRDAASTSAPSAALLQQARSQMAADQYPQAAASLERAIRIEPGNAWLWLELAKVHFASGNLPQAQSHARKAASLAGGDDAARRAADDLLARIGGQ